jgi:hypothetical protein
MGASRERDYETVVREMRSAEYGALLGVLQGTEPFLCRFRSWDDVITFMRNGTSRDPDKNVVLQAILRAHSETHDHRLRTVLLVIFWPGLEAILNRKKRWDANEDERWQSVMWAFVETVCRLDIGKRTDRLVQRIINGTIHRLYEEYRRVWRITERETATDPEQLDELAEDGEELDFDAMDLRAKQEAEINRLRAHADAGRISEADFLLLVGTRVYGKTAAQYARETGVSCDLARKRRLRAEAAIRSAKKGR